MAEKIDTSVSWLVVGTIHIPPYIDIDVKDCLRQIAEKQVTIEKKEYLYTICNVTEVENGAVAGLLLKFAKKASEEVFNYQIWAPREYGVSDKVITGSRFLVGESNQIVLEDKKPQLSRTNFASRLEDLLGEVVKSEYGGVFQLDVYFHKDPNRIQKFIREHKVVSSITLTNIKIKNPLPKTEGVADARVMIEDSRMTKCEIENPSSGINKEGNLFKGFVTLSEEGQLDLEIQAPRVDRSGRVSIDSFMSKLRLYRKRIDIRKDLGSFINEASQLLRDHLKRSQGK